MGGRVQQLHLRPAVIAHPLQIDVYQRLEHVDALGPLDGKHRPNRADVGEDHLLARRFGPLARQVGADPSDDFLPVAGIDDDDVERLSVGIVIIAHQHVVENAADVVRDQRIADLAQLHVGHAAGEQFGQKDGRAGPLEPQPAHVRNIGDGHGISRGVVFLDDRSILHRHGPAGEIDHPSAVGHVPIKKRGSQQVRVHTVCRRARWIGKDGF